MVPASDTDPTVSLRLEEVGTHPVLNYGEDPNFFLDEIEVTPYPFTEIRTPYVQIHTKTDMMKTSIAQYDGDIEIYD